MRMLTQIEVLMGLARQLNVESLEDSLDTLSASSEKINTISNSQYDLSKKRKLIEKEAGNLLLNLTVITNSFDIDLYDVIEQSRESFKAIKAKEKVIKQSKKKAGINDEQLKKVKLISRKSLKDIVKGEVDRTIKENKGLKPPKTNFAELDLSEEEMLDIKNEIKKKHLEKNSNGRIYPDKIYKKEELLESFKFLEDNKDYRGSFLVKLLLTEQEIKNELYNSSIEEDESMFDSFRENKEFYLSVYDIVAASKDLKRFIISFEFNVLTGIIKFKRIIKRKDLELSSYQRRELNSFLENKKLISDETVR
jgi:hypothetical protein